MMKNLKIQFAAMILLVCCISACKKNTTDPGETPTNPGNPTLKVKMAEYNFTIGTTLTFSNQGSFRGVNLVDKDVLYRLGGVGTNSLLMVGFKPDTSIVFAKKFNFPQSPPNVDNMISDGNGGFIISGRYNQGYPFLARINSSGAFVWSKKITDTKNSIYSSGTDMFVLPGLSEVKNQRFALFFNDDIILLDLDGVVRWRAGTNRTYRGVLTDEGLIAFGQRSGDTRFTIKKLDMNGKLLWSKSAENGANAAMAFGKPLVLSDKSILLSYVHKSTINAVSNYGLFNISPDGNIKSNKLYLAAPIQPDRDNRPAELHRKSDNKIWFHFPGRKYLSAGQSEPLEVGFNLNEDGTVDESGFFQGENSSFGFANNKVISIHEGRVLDGSLSSSCSSTGNKVNLQEAFLSFGEMKTFTEQLSTETFTTADYPFTIEDAGAIKINVIKRCQ